jgi:uncharacterized protein YpmB
MRYLLITLVVFAVIGCNSSAAKTKSTVPIEQVPEAAMKTARSKAPTIKFDKAIKRAGGVYEIQGKNKAGKVVEVEVKENGEFITIE